MEQEGDKMYINSEYTSHDNAGISSPYFELLESGDPLDRSHLKVDYCWNPYRLNGLDYWLLFF